MTDLPEKKKPIIREYSEVKQSLKNLYNTVPVTFWVVTNLTLHSRDELIRHCMDRNCVYGFALRPNRAIILCRKHGGYDYGALQASIGHFLGDFLSADAVKKVHYPSINGGDE